MICKKCGRFINGDRCLFCGADSRSSPPYIKERQTTICFNCGAVIDENSSKCRRCGVPKGMTARQYKYAAKSENRFLPLAIAFTVIVIAAFIATMFMQSLIIGLIALSFIGFTFSMLSLFEFVYGGSGRRASIVCLAVNAVIISSYLISPVLVIG